MHCRVERHVSPLGRWLLARARPSSLAPFVDQIWYFEGRIGELRERHFPDGRVQIVVHLGPLYRRVVDGRAGDTFPRLCLAGLQLRPDVIEAPPEPSRVLGLILRPAGAFRIVAHPLHELTNRNVDLADVARAAGDRLLERCGEARGARECIAAATAWLEERFRAHPGADPAIVWIAGEIERRAGAVTVRELRERTGWSKSRLARTFREQIGVPPKALARTVRFRSALERLNRKEGPLVEIALASGYYDQPHFNAEFLSLSGFTPTEYLARRRYPESVNLAESAG